MKIALIGCVKKKADKPCEAKDMYISPLFKGCYRLAKKLEAEKIYILSAKYGLIEENQIIKPYNETLNDKSEYERKIWAYNICQSLLRGGVNLDKDEFIILAGENYRKWLIRKLKHYTIPLKGLSLFNQIKYLKSV